MMILQFDGNDYSLIYIIWLIFEWYALKASAEVTIMSPLQEDDRRSLDASGSRRIVIQTEGLYPYQYPLSELNHKSSGWRTRLPSYNWLWCFACQYKWYIYEGPIIGIQLFQTVSQPLSPFWSDPGPQARWLIQFSRWILVGIQALAWMTILLLPVSYDDPRSSYSA